MTSHGGEWWYPVTKSRSIADTELPNDLRKNSGEFAGAFFRRPITLGREFTGEFTRESFSIVSSLSSIAKNREKGERKR